MTAIAWFAPTRKSRPGQRGSMPSASASPESWKSMGGKNMTFSQRIEAVRQRDCDGAQRQ